MNLLKNILNYFRNNPLAIILILAVIYFISHSIFYALSFPLHVIPDEREHLALVQEYRSNGNNIFAEREPTHFHLYAYTWIPSLYHVSLAFLLNFNFDFLGITDLMFLRVINILLGLCSLVLLYLTSLKVTKSQKLSLIVMLLLLNTTMFIMLPTGLNYGNLINLLFYFALYFFVRYIYDKNGNFLLLSIIFMLLACIAKYTILPLLCVFIILTTFYLIKNKWKLTDFTRIFNNLSKLRIILLIFTGIILTYFVAIYVTSMVKYQTYRPECSQVFSREECFKNPIYARTQGWIERKTEANPKLKPVDLYGEAWLRRMLTSSHGMLTNKFLFSNEATSFIIVLFLVSFVSSTLFVRNKDKLYYYFVITFFLYFLFLFLFNYRTQILYTPPITMVAVQGRYLFPVLPLIYLAATMRIKYTKKSNLLINTFLTIFSLLIIYNTLHTYYSIPDEYIN